MDCKYCEEFTGICTNAECPMVADTCPVPDQEGVCRYEEREVPYKLTPKGIVLAALMDAGLVSNIDDPAVEVFWEAFSEMMEKNGYVKTTEQEDDQ